MPRTLSVEEFKELGKRYYGRKDFQRALDAFTDGINASTGRDIQLYDYRAATNMKLGNESGALSDAKHMIKAFEKDPKGYLRAGRLLLCMDKQPQALLIYARGMTKVPSSHPDINVLRGEHDKLNRELCPPNAVDPFTQLPHELVEMIMSYLRFYEVVSCLRVSKQWKVYLESLPGLWTKMDLLRSGRRSAVNAGFVKRVVQMSKQGVKEARIANMGSKGMLMHLVTTCKSLEKLEFVMSPLGTQSVLEAVIPARSLKSLMVHADMEVHGDTIAQILKHRPTLEELRIHRVGKGCLASKAVSQPLPKLKVLDLRNVHPNYIATTHLDKLVAHTPHLNNFVYEELNPNEIKVGYTRSLMPDLTHCTLLEHISISSNVLVGFPLVITNNIRSMTLHARASGISLRPVVMLPNVERLNLQCVMAMNLLGPVLGDGAEGVSSIAALTYSSDAGLDVLANPPMNQAEPTMLGMDVLVHPRLHELEELSLSGIVGAEIDDSQVPKLLALKRLRRLELDSARITGVALKQLVTGLKGTLDWIGLRACDNIGHDAIDWAARQGVEVVVRENGVKVVRRR